MTVTFVSRRVSPSLDVCASRQLTGTVGFLAPSRARFRGSSAEYFARAVLGVKDILVYFDWVPTDDNPADWPTREDKFHLIPPEAVEAPMRIPPSALFGPLNGDSAVLATWQAALNRRQPEAGQP